MRPSEIPTGDRVQYLELTFFCTPVTGRAHVHDEESIDVGWFPVGDLPVDTRSREKVLQALSGGAASFQPAASPGKLDSDLQDLV
jgi:hypothetical protein